MSNDSSPESPSGLSSSQWIAASTIPIISPALFIGLVTLDLLYLAEQPLQPNGKQVAQDYQLCPGGPATNAAITFAYLGYQATVHPETVARIITRSRTSQAQTKRATPSSPSNIPSLTHQQASGSQSGLLLASLGQHPLAQLVETEIQRWGIQVMDVTPERQEPPSLSSIVVSRAIDEAQHQRSNRAIISINARHHQAPAPARQELLQLLGQNSSQDNSQFSPSTQSHPKVLLIDGHQMALSQAIAPLAQACNIPVVVDGGSWKPGFETVLAATDYALCSANFRPPNCGSETETVAYLQALSIPHIAITHGGEPIHYWQLQGQATEEHSHDRPTYSRGTIPVPTIQPLDTLGAGDIFHGAFCYSILHCEFVAALAEAAAVASYACEFFGPRTWQQAEGSQL